MFCKCLLELFNLSVYFIGGELYVTNWANWIYGFLLHFLEAYKVVVMQPFTDHWSY